MSHEIGIRVYYEDTDLAGIVYYANYLKFIERARTEWVRGLGIEQGRLREEGVVFAVRRLVADYRAPARFDDLLRVVTTPRRVSGARADLLQEVWRGEDCLFRAEVTLAAVGADGRPARLPRALREALAAG